MNLMLGKTLARPGAIKLKLADYLKGQGTIAKPPLRFGNLKAWNAWQWLMLANDVAGCCVWSGFAHQCMMWAATEGNRDVSFTDDQILGPDAYGSTGYVKGDASTDNGTDMVTACEFWQKNTFLGHHIQAFAEVTPANLVEAAFIFGSVGIGVLVAQAQMDQFDHNEPWDVTDDQNYIGGHYVPVIGRNAQGNLLCVTWGRLQAITPAFIEAQCDEAVCQVSDDWLNTVATESPRGLKLADLLADAKTLEMAQ